MDLNRRNGEQCLCPWEKGKTTVGWETKEIPIVHSNLLLTSVLCLWWRVVLIVSETWLGITSLEIHPHVIVLGIITLEAERRLVGIIECAYSFSWISEKEKLLSTEFQLLSNFLCWGTRTRTRKGRTRICSVTITPYPTVVCATRCHSWFAGAKVQHFPELPKFFSTFF